MEAVDARHLESLEATFGDKLFARGYLISATKPVFVPAAWSSVDLGRGYTLWHDPRTPHTVAAHAGAEVHAIGHILSVDRPRRDAAAVVRSLARALDRSDAAFFEALDRLHGRFVLLYARNGDAWRATMDATGMRSIYYDAEARALSSHPTLAALVASRSALEPPFQGYGRPGRTSGFEGVVLATPNLELRLDEYSLHRYWPREPIPTLPTPKSARAASKAMARSLRGIRRRHAGLVASLTAGTDSRATLAIALAARATAGIEFFTYSHVDPSPSEHIDAVISRQLADHYHLRHREILLSSGTDARSPEVADLLKINSPHRHGPLLTESYMELYGGEPVVHLRSNLSEIARSFYLRKRARHQPPTTGDDLAHIYMHTMAHSVEPPLEGRDVIAENFREQFEATDFAAGAALIDARDLLYWEHRMGAWHSAIVLESDVAFETLSLYNSRAVLVALLSTSPEDRLNDAHMHEIMYEADRALLDFPFNRLTKRKADVSPAVARRADSGRERLKSRVRKTVHRVDDAMPWFKRARTRALRAVRRGSKVKA